MTSSASGKSLKKPYYTRMIQEEKPFYAPLGRSGRTAVAQMVEEGFSIGDIANRLKRSPDAVALKVKRLGLAVPGDFFCGKYRE